MALTADQIDHYRLILTARRAELARETVAVERRAGDENDPGPQDPTDQATASLAQDELLGEAERDSELLAQIDAALLRIRDGSYGRCTACGREIPTERLDAVPWAALCVEDQEIADRRGETKTMAGGAPSRVTL